MGLSYDFDMFAVMPPEVFQDHGVRHLLQDAGLTGMADRRIALFRDPRTVAALQGSSERVRAYFESSGFGFNAYASGAPAGRYPAEDEAARLAVIRRLADNLSRFDLAAEDLNGFEFDAFLAGLDAAAPIDMEAAAAHRSGSGLRAGLRWGGRLAAAAALVAGAVVAWQILGGSAGELSAGRVDGGGTLLTGTAD